MSTLSISVPCLVVRNVQVHILRKNCSKRKIQGVPQSQTAGLPRKKKQTKPNKRKSNKRTKSTKISSLFPKRGNRNAKWTENTQEQNNTS